MTAGKPHGAARRRWTAYVILALLTAGCGGKGGKKRSGKRKARTFTVQVQSVTTRTISDDIRATGSSRPVREMLLSTQVQGSITSLKVTMGRKVKKGELLARVSTVGLWGDSQQVYADLKRLKSDIEQAKTERKDTERLYRQKLLSRKQYDDARYKLIRLQAQYTQAQARLSSVGERFRGGSVRAPFAGVIASQGAELGDYVSPGKVIGRLVDLSAVKVTVGLAEVDMVRVTTATPVVVEFPALGSRRFPGKILAMAPVADAQTGAFAVEIRIANPKGTLRGGMAARAVFKRPGITGIFVPVEAVVQRGGKPVVYVVNTAGDQVQLRTCRVGLRRDGFVKVISGLRVGDRLVVSGNTRLRDGSKVRISGSMARGMGRPGGPRSEARAGMGSAASSGRPSAKQ